MTCPECGEGTLKEGTLTIQGQVRGEATPVELRGEECSSCGFQVIDAADMAAYGRATSDAYRARHSLLTSAELKARRERLGMGQVPFAEYTKIGQASIKRWELGAIQDEAMDELIRLKTDPAAALRNLEEVRRLLRLQGHLEGGQEVTLRTEAARRCGRRRWQTGSPQRYSRRGRQREKFAAALRYPLAV